MLNCSFYFVEKGFEKMKIFFSRQRLKIKIDTDFILKWQSVTFVTNLCSKQKIAG